MNIISYIKKFEKIIKEYTKNGIEFFITWFFERIVIHYEKEYPHRKFYQWEIFEAHLWYNIWSELNKYRPIVVISHTSFNGGNTLLILPLKTNHNDKISKDWVYIEKNNDNNLKHDWIALIGQIRCIDKKRLGKKIWKLSKKQMKEIQEKITIIIWNKKESHEDPLLNSCITTSRGIW